MCNHGKVPAPSPGAYPDSRLAQHALACEISGDLDRAVALIRCLQRSAAGGYPAAPRSAAGGERRIA